MKRELEATSVSTSSSFQSYPEFQLRQLLRSITNAADLTRRLRNNTGLSELQHSLISSLDICLSYAIQLPTPMVSVIEGTALAQWSLANLHISAEVGSEDDDAIVMVKNTKSKKVEFFNWSSGNCDIPKTIDWVIAD